MFNRQIFDRIFSGALVALGITTIGTILYASSQRAQAYNHALMTQEITENQMFGETSESMMSKPYFNGSEPMKGGIPGDEMYVVLVPAGDIGWPTVIGEVHTTFYKNDERTDYRFGVLSAEPKEL